ncbi:MAG: AtpZ/AtpI family protein [Armatimonadetes bacterium]|nr:AtpZ/AtpI family protein [Armatimonadota bacterium]
MSVVGLTLAFCIAIGTGGGIWLDKRLGTEPAFTVVGFLLGAIAGFRELFRAIQKG